jgi:phage protein D
MLKGDLFWRVTASAGGASYDLSGDLSSFTVEEEDRSPTRLTVQVSDPLRVFSHGFREGVDIEAELGTADDHGVVFRGRIYHVDAGLPQDGTPTLTLKAYDASMVMGLRERNRRFRDLPLSEVIRKVAEPHFEGRPLRIQLLGDPVFDGEGLRQRDETDLCFLRRLAEEAHCVMGIELAEDGETFTFTAEQFVLQSEPTVVLHYGRCNIPHRLLTFTGQVDVGSIAVPRSIAAMDAKTGEVVDPRDSRLEEVGKVEDKLRDENLAAFEDRHPDQGPTLRELIEAAEAVEPTLRAELGKARRDAIAAFASSDQVIQHGEQQPSTSLHGMQASGSTVGTKDLHVRTALGIEGGGRFSGSWFVSKATHTFDRQGYRTEFTCQR